MRHTALWLALAFVLAFAGTLKWTVPEWRTGRQDVEPLTLSNGDQFSTPAQRIWIDTDAACGTAARADPDDCLAITARQQQLAALDSRRHVPPGTVRAGLDPTTTQRALMETLLHEIARHVAYALELIAVSVIALGAIEAVIGIVRVKMRSEGRREVWLLFARWLVAGMTFQLAADVVSTSFDPTWDQIGHLAAIAGVRTFLSFFLDREMEAKEEATRERAKAA